MVGEAEEPVVGNESAAEVIDPSDSSPDEALPVAANPSAPVVLDDSDYRIPDEWGLKEAYNADESVVHDGDTLYIAGTHSLRDVLDDALIPLHLVRTSQRYQQALAALQSANGRVKYLSGHSLGGRSRPSCKRTPSRGGSDRTTEASARCERTARR